MSRLGLGPGQTSGIAVPPPRSPASVGGNNGWGLVSHPCRWVGPAHAAAASCAVVPPFLYRPSCVCAPPAARRHCSSAWCGASALCVGVLQSYAPPVSAAPSPGANMGDLDVEEWVLQSCGGDMRGKTQGEGEGEETGVKERWAATRGAATSFGAFNERPFIVPRSSFKLFF